MKGCAKLHQETPLASRDSRAVDEFAKVFEIRKVPKECDLLDIADSAQSG